jgi:uncharacterized repeat protein (TIGR04076 family)
MYKVRCRLLGFEGDEQLYPCHFGYKIGDEIFYDGVHFTGRVCPGLLDSMMPVVRVVFLVGYKYSENVFYLYRGLDTRDPGMQKYDGVGFKPLKELPEGVQKPSLLPTGLRTEKARMAHFLCADHRILAHFVCEPVDLSDSYYAQPFYRRALAILDKITAEPGIYTEEILSRFTDFERNEISPPLTPVFQQVLLEALSDLQYIEIKQNRVYATSRQPPSRPGIS